MELIKSRHEATGMTDAEASYVYRVLPASPFRKVVEYDIEKRKMQIMRDPRSDKNDGIIEGLNLAIAILNQKPR